MTSDQLLSAADQLPSEELDELARRVAHLAAYRKCPSLASREAQLLREVNNEPDTARVERYLELRSKRKTSQLDDAETEELLVLSDWLEEVHAKRMEAVAELARIRGLSLRDMMDRLGVKHLVKKP